MTAPDYPLKFRPIYKEKVWGGRTLERLGRSLPGGHGAGIGESWELADLQRTSASGGGGSAEHSVVDNGPLAGQSIDALIAADRDAVLGGAATAADGGFPLLLKLLDARQNLSVQVHPSPAYAASHDDAFLKSEAWYVVDCEPGAKIYKGVQPGTTPEKMRAALEENTDDAVVPLLIEVPVAPGDCHYLPSGTCHALGAGVLVAEVQTPSDTTFRVYDWGRTGRELHVDQALECITFGPAETRLFEAHTTIDSGDGVTTTRLVRTEYFRIDRLTATSGASGDIGERIDALPRVWMVLAGRGELACASQDSVPFAAGETILLPAAMTDGQWSANADLTLLEVTLPEGKAPKVA